MLVNDILTAHASAFRNKTGVKNKLSIIDMTRLLNDLSWSKENLLRGTNREYEKRPMSGWGIQSTASNGPVYNIDSFKGKIFTYSATITNLGKIPVRLEIKLMKNGSLVMSEISSNVNPNEKDKDVSVTINIPRDINANQVSLSVITSSGDGTNNDIVEIKDERLYEGIAPGIWTPNPADKVGG